MGAYLPFVLIGLLLSLPTPALSKGAPLTDAQLEEVAALSEDLNWVADMGLSQPEEPANTSDSLQRLIEKWSLQVPAVPTSPGVLHIDPTSPLAGIKQVPSCSSSMCPGTPVVGSSGTTGGLTMTLNHANR